MQCLARLTYYINSLCPTQRHGRPRKTTQRGGVYCAEVRYSSQILVINF